MVRGGLASSGNSEEIPFYIEENSMHDFVTYILLKAILYGCIILLIGGLTMEVYYSI